MLFQASENKVAFSILNIMKIVPKCVQNEELYFVTKMMCISCDLCYILLKKCVYMGILELVSGMIIWIGSGGTASPQITNVENSYKIDVIRPVKLPFIQEEMTL